MRTLDNSHCVFLKIEPKQFQTEIRKIREFLRERCSGEFSDTPTLINDERIFMFENTEDAMIFRLAYGGR